MTPTTRRNDDKQWPDYLLWGRVRTSTAVLLGAFLLTWWTYDTYRPQPPEPAPAQQAPPGMVPAWIPKTQVYQPQPYSPEPTATTTSPTETPEPTTTETTETSPTTTDVNPFPWLQPPVTTTASDTPGAPTPTVSASAGRAWSVKMSKTYAAT